MKIWTAPNRTTNRYIISVDCYKMAKQIAKDTKGSIRIRPRGPRFGNYHDSSIKYATHFDLYYKYKVI